MKSDLQSVLCVCSLFVAKAWLWCAAGLLVEIPRDSISTFGADIMTRLPLASISFENIFKFIYLNLNKIRTDVGRTTKTPQLSFGKNRLSRWVTRAVEPSVHFM